MDRQGILPLARSTAALGLAALKEREPTLRILLQNLLVWQSFSKIKL
jgi:hypothetical protein